MKTILIITAMALSVCVSGKLEAQVAQTNAPANFFQSVQGYLTSFNTNYTFVGNTFEAATGYKQVTGVGAQSVVDAQYDINKFHICASMGFAGVGSAVDTIEGGFGYDLIEHYDTVLEADFLTGYDWNAASVVIEPKIDVKKKLTPNTFAETGISLPIDVTRKVNINRSPCVFVEAGFTY